MKIEVILLLVLRTIAAWICFCILWLAALLAIFGVSWRRLPNLSCVQAGGTTLFLAVWAIGLLGLYRILHQEKNNETNVFTESLGHWAGIKNHLLQNKGILLPVLFLCFLLPMPWQIPYLLLIVFAEFLWRPLGIISGKTEMVVPAEQNPASTNGTPHPSPLAPCPSPLAPDSEEEELSEMFLAEGMVQQMVRSRTEADADRFEGTFLVEFQDQQWTQSIHIPFCPAFEDVPNIDSYLLEEVPAKIKMHLPQVYGVRIDVKREPTAPKRFHIFVTAQIDAKE